MTHRIRQFFFELAGALLLGVTLALVMPQAHAALIGTDEAVSAAQAREERDRVRSFVERPELASTLEKMGIAPHDAKARVDAMNDAEVHALAGKLDLLPAGGAVGNTDLVLILVLILLLVVLL
jgi:hypothetical protein